MHRLQQQIIYRLSQETQLRYARLKPAEVEGNHFMYHLKKLMDEGLVRKSEGLYELTPAGTLYLSRLSLKTFEPRIQPKIVNLVACHNQAGEWLLYERSREPFKGLYGFPYGKIHLGERVQEAAERELEEKTGLTAELTHRGDAYITIWKGGELISHMLCHVFEGKDPKGELRGRSDIGECLWEFIDHPEDGRYFYGFKEIYELVSDKEGPYFFKEFTYETK
jgi:ADP-ribose pyrophosphatase YjhB (NUDIX family)